jgi:hypothetical protein
MPDEIGLGVTKVNSVINPLAQVEGGESHKSYNRIIIEYCCSPTSKIGIYTTWSKGYRIIRITETLDATKQSTLDFILHSREAGFDSTDCCHVAEIKSFSVRQYRKGNHR